MSSNLIVPDNAKVIEYNGEPVITLAMMDQLHERPDGTARRTLAKHRGKLLEGVDYVTSDGGCTQNVHPIQDGTIRLTLSGYLILVKAFRDDKAWEVQRYLVNHYFRSKSVTMTAIGHEIARGIRSGLEAGLAPLQDDVKHLKVDVAAVKATLVDLGDQVARVVNRKSLTARTMRQHIDTVADFFNCMCPCCSKRRVLSDSLTKLATAHWDHWYAPHRFGVQETWLVCQECNEEMKDHSVRQKRQPFFNAFQLRRDEKHCPLFSPFDDGFL